jgi:hypothetical protein
MTTSEKYNNDHCIKESPGLKGRAQQTSLIEAISLQGLHLIQLTQS